MYFAVDRAYSFKAETHHIYDSSLRRLIYQCIMRFQSMTLIACGPDGTGKTFSLFDNYYSASAIAMQGFLTKKKSVFVKTIYKDPKNPSNNKSPPSEVEITSLQTFHNFLHQMKYDKVQGQDILMQIRYGCKKHQDHDHNMYLNFVKLSGYQFNNEYEILTKAQSLIPDQ